MIQQKQQKNFQKKKDLEKKENQMKKIDDYLSTYMKNINGIVISKENGTPIYLKKYKYNTNFFLIKINTIFQKIILIITHGHKKN